MKYMNSGNRCHKVKRFIALIQAAVLMFIVLCGSGRISESDISEETGRMFYAHVNDKVLKILAEENTSAEAFLELLKTGDLTVEMNDYGSFEKVGPLGTTLPRNDEQITTEPGDVILYQGEMITIYYDVNSWNFTRLGKVQELSQAELKEILGDGDVTVTFSLSEKRPSEENADVLVVIFSRTGHTKPLAEYIAEYMNADMYEIEAKDRTGNRAILPHALRSQANCRTFPDTTQSFSAIRSGTDRLRRSFTPSWKMWIFPERRSSRFVLRTPVRSEQAPKTFIRLPRTQNGMTADVSPSERQTRRSPNG